MSTIQYPFDPTGKSPGNYIQYEQHAVTEANFRDYFFIVPNFAPFFTDNLVIRHYYQNEVRTLELDVDYYLAMPFIGATRSIGKAVYGGITLNNQLTVGTVSVSYQTLGGTWTADRNYVLEQLAEKVYNPRLTVWDNITNVQETFPAINHDLNFDYVFGQKELIDAVITLANSIANADADRFLRNHVTDLNNPHHVTKIQVGLSDVENLPVATLAEVRNRAAVRKYLTLDQLIDFMNHQEKYSITADRTVTEEGEVITFVVNTIGVSDGTVLYWSVEHGTTNDYDFFINEGAIVVNENFSKFSIKTSDNTVNGRETFHLYLRSESLDGPVIAQTVQLALVSKTGNTLTDLANACCIYTPGISITPTSLFIIGNK